MLGLGVQNSEYRMPQAPSRGEEPGRVASRVLVGAVSGFRRRPRWKNRPMQSPLVARSRCGFWLLYGRAMGTAC